MKKRKEMKKIKQGTKLICCNEMFINDILCLVKGNIYTVQTSDKENYFFSIIGEQGYIHCFDYSDVPNVWFNFYEPKQDKIVTKIVDKFKQRSEIGIKKYNTTLAENNTDDFFEHLSEELMDSLLYLQKIKEQKDTYFKLLGRYNELKEQFEKLQAKIKELC